MIPGMRSWLLLGGVMTVVACGGGSARSGFDDGSEPTKATDPNDPTTSAGEVGPFGKGDPSMEIVPKNTTVIIDSATSPATPGKLVYKVLANGKDITPGTQFTLKDTSLGSFANETFNSVASLPAGTMGKSSIVYAKNASGQALGRLTVVQLRKTGAQRDFFFVVPYGEDPDPKTDVLAFSTSLKKVDVAFVMDTTGSMSGSITNLKTALNGTLLSQLQASIPDVGLGIVDHRDFPTGSYGDSGDWPVKVRQTVNTSLALAQAAVNQYAAGGGNDGPEAQVPAMQHVLTGEGLNWSGGSVPAHVSPAGFFGGVDFRPGAVPVVVLITDVTWHDETHTPYSFTAPSMASLKTAFKNKNAFFVDITSGDESQANDLSDASNSHVAPASFAGCAAGQCCTGVNGAARAASGPGGTCRLNFLHSNGTGVSAGVSQAIKAIALGASYDVKAIPSNDPANPGGADATKFIKALRAMDEGNPANGCPAAAANDTDGDGIKDTFVNLKVGTPVCFEIIPAKNTTVPPTDDPQFLNAFIDVIGIQGNVQLDHRSVLFLVPPKDPSVN